MLNIDENEEKPIRLALTDPYGQIVRDDNKTPVRISIIKDDDDDEVTLAGPQKDYSPTNGILTLHPLSLLKSNPSKVY